MQGVQTRGDERRRPWRLTSALIALIALSALIALLLRAETDPTTQAAHGPDSAPRAPAPVTTTLAPPAVSSPANATDPALPSALTRPTASPVEVAGLPVRLQVELGGAPRSGIELAFTRDGQRVAGVSDAAGRLELTLARGRWTLELPPQIAGRAGPFGVRAFRRPRDPEEFAPRRSPDPGLVLVVRDAPPADEPGEDEDPDEQSAAGTVEWTPADLAAGRPLRVCLYGPAAVCATVRDLSGAPIAGAWVAVRPAEEPDRDAEPEGETPARPAEPGARTDAAGRAVVIVPGSPATSFTLLVRATAPGLGSDAAWSQLRGLPGQEDPSWPLRGTPQGDVREAYRPVELRLGPALVLEGTVCDAAGHGLPAALTIDYQLTAERASAPARPRRVVCDAGGRFRAEGIPIGAAGRGACPGPRCAAVVVSAELEGWLPVREEVVIGPGLAPPRLVLHPAQPIEVRVRDADGSPLPGAHVLHAPTGLHHRVRSLSGESLFPATDAEGRVRLDPIPLHTWLVAWAPGHVAALFEVRLPLASIELTLERGAALEGLLRRAEGVSFEYEVQAGFVDQPRTIPRRELSAPGVRRANEAPGVWPIDRAEVDSQGRFRLSGVPAGRDLRLRVGDDWWIARAGQRDLVLDQDPARRGELQVLAVRAEDDTPLQPVRGEVLSGAGDRLEVWSRGRPPADEASRVRAWGLGPLELLIRSEGRVPARVRATLTAGDQLDLGQVRLARGARLALRPQWPAAPLRGLRVAWQAPALELADTETLACPRGAAEPLLLRAALPAGTSVAVRIEALPWDEAAAPREVLATELTLTAGETRPLSLALR